MPQQPPVQVTFSELSMPWYGTNERVTAWATVPLAVITLGLAVYTALLFRAAQRAHKDSEKALNVAKEQMT